MSLVSTAVSIANSVTGNLKLQSDVLHEVSTGMDRSGKQVYPAGGGVLRKAVVEEKKQLVRDQNSNEVVQARISILFLDPTIIVRLSDRLTLANGNTGPIIDTGGFIDGETNQAAYREIFLG